MSQEAFGDRSQVLKAFKPGCSGGSRGDMEEARPGTQDLVGVG